MNYMRFALASLGAFVAYMVLGGAIFAVAPSLKDEFAQYPAVYRSQAGQLSHMPIGMAAMFLAMVALTFLYARFSARPSGLVEGSIFGALIGLFAVGSFVIHNYVNLNIGLGITLISAAIFFVQWTIVGAVIGAIYRSPVSR